ncbi:Uncharacterised protein [Vibrio cholerae]|nr:Uncharacterised protein [Vibrio cholerae]
MGRWANRRLGSNGSNFGRNLEKQTFSLCAFCSLN